MKAVDAIIGGTVFRALLRLSVVATLALSGVAAGLAWQSGRPHLHPAIAYPTAPRTDRVATLQERLRRENITLDYDRALGFLPALLELLDVPAESQTLVFSKTSLQADEIGPDNPRAIYFTDDVAIAWIRGAPVIEIAALDPEQGVMFYTLGQRDPLGRRGFQRPRSCLDCHIADTTLGVPGLAVGSAVVDASGVPYRSAPIDHRSEIAARWGGWYVTGETGTSEHLGNATADERTTEITVDPANLNLPSVERRVDLDGYLTPYSDIAALMVLEHQTHMTNLLIRVGWEFRMAADERSPTRRSADELAQPLARAVDEVVDYLLFIDEAPLDDPMRGNAGFETMFAGRGPFDRQGRTLRELDLQRRVFRYPCSYMIYTATFDRLPAAARSAIYRRMWEVLSGTDESPRYDRLSGADRRAIVEILRDTKPDLPLVFDGDIR